MTFGARLLTPDDVLLRRFGLVRAVGGAAYIVGVAVMFLLLGRQVWPLALGAPLLAVVTTAYFLKSNEYPRASVVLSLVADALVLSGVVAYLGGAASGLILLQAIVVVSAGLLMGPAAAAWFTLLTAGLGVLQFVFEHVGSGERLPIFLSSLAGLVSVGYLSGTYASRLHELIAEAGAAAEATRARGRQGRDLLLRAAKDASESLRAVEELADQLEEPLGEHERRRRSGALRVRLAQLDADVSQLADVGSLMEVGEERPEPILLRRTVEDCVIGLGDRVDSHELEVDVPPIRVVGYRRAARRVVHNLLENAVAHTPAGTRVRVTAVSSGARGVLVVTDDGPGIPPEIAVRMFDPVGGETGREPHSDARVGLPLVRQLCESMGAEVRYEPVPQGGSRFLVGFRLAPGAVPDAEYRPPRR